MRMFPQSRRGTWLLAGAAWVGLCALAWALLPIKPRAAWPALPTTGLVGFVPGSRTLVTYTTRTANNEEPPIGPVEFHDSNTGHTLSILSTDDPITMIELSPDGRSAVVRSGNEHARLRIFDIATGRSRVELPRDYDSGGDRATFSPDGRWLVYSDSRATTSIRIWDVSENRECPAPAAVLWPWAFSPDSRLLAYGVREGRHPPTRVALWEVASGQSGTTFQAPAGHNFDDLRFSPDGGTLLTLLEASVRKGNGPPTDLLNCGWEVTTGRERFRKADENSLTYYPPRATWYAVAADPGPVRRIDYATGQECGQFALAHENRIGLWNSGMTPDGQYLLVDGVTFNPLLLWLNSRLLKRPQEQFITERLKILDTSNGQTVAILPAQIDWTRRNGWERTRISPDGLLMALMTDADIEIWDLPPRTSLFWFTLTAGVLALPLAGLAWRRSRRLQREAV